MDRFPQTLGSSRPNGSLTIEEIANNGLDSARTSNAAASSMRVRPLLVRILARARPTTEVSTSVPHPPRHNLGDRRQPPSLIRAGRALAPDVCAVSATNGLVQCRSGTSGLVQCRSEDGAPLEAAPGWCSLSHLCAYLARELEWKSAGSSLREVRVRVPYASPGGVRRRLSDPRGVVNDTHACAPQVVSLGDTEVRGFPSTFRVSPGPFVQR